MSRVSFVAVFVEKSSRARSRRNKEWLEIFAKGKRTREKEREGKKERKSEEEKGRERKYE